MGNSRGPTQKKYRRTPVDDPSLTQRWRELYIKYTQIDGLGKHKSLERIAIQHNTSRSTVLYHLDKIFRLQQIKKQKGKTSHKKTTEYKLRDSTIHHIHNNIEFYIQRVFEKADYHLLSIDDIRYGIVDVLADKNKPKILIRGTTLLKLINKYENNFGKRIIKKLDNLYSIINPE